MKTIYSLIFISYFSLSKAQIVNIPDPVFKQLLVDNNEINTNHDSEIQISEALATDSIDLRWNITQTNFDSLNGIEEFKNLEYLNVYGGIKYSWETPYHLDFSSNTKLKTLDISANSVGTINLTANLNLEKLYATETLLQDSLDLSNNTNLILLDIIGHYTLKTICLPSLSIVNSNFNKPDFTDFSESCSLITNIWSNTLSEVSLSPNPFSNTLQLKGVIDREVKLTVFNSLGAIVHQQNVKNSLIEFSHLENGMYYFELKAGEKKTTHKLIKK